MRPIIKLAPNFYVRRKKIDFLMHEKRHGQDGFVFLGAFVAGVRVPSSIPIPEGKADFYCRKIMGDLTFMEKIKVLFGRIK